MINYYYYCSGESGTGKTETCKYIIRHLTELSTGDRGLEKRIMQVLCSADIHVLCMVI